MVVGQWLPDCTDHWLCRGADVGGALETAFRMPLGLGRTFEVALSGGGGGADMLFCWVFVLVE